MTVIAIYMTYQIFICEVELIMQDEHMSVLSCQQLSQDQDLVQLFQQIDQQQQFLFNQLQTIKPAIQNFDLRAEQLEKGYASDSSPCKKYKQKKIKKKRPMAPIKEEKNKNNRSKLYIESLQNRILDLQSEVEKLRKLNKVNMEYIKKLNDSEQIMNGFFIDRQKIFQKLEKLIQTDCPDQRRIELQCYCLQMKQGSFGNQRIKAINYYFKQLIELILPNAQKYLNWAALQNTELFNPDSISEESIEWRHQMFKQLMLSQETLQLMSSKRLEIIQCKSKFNKKIVEFFDKKCQLIQNAREMQIILEKISENMTPIQTARFLCEMQKYKFQNQSYLQQSVLKIYQQLENDQRFSYKLTTSPQATA